jgi:hypothetical protein
MCLYLLLFRESQFWPHVQRRGSRPPWIRLKWGTWEVFVFYGKTRSKLSTLNFVMQILIPSSERGKFGRHFVTWMEISQEATCVLFGKGRAGFNWGSAWGGWISSGYRLIYWSNGRGSSWLSRRNSGTSNEVHWLSSVDGEKGGNTFVTEVGGDWWLVVSVVWNAGDWSFISQSFRILTSANHHNNQLNPSCNWPPCFKIDHKFPSKRRQINSHERRRSYPALCSQR